MLFRSFLNAAFLTIIGIKSFIHSSSVPEEMQIEFVSLPRVTPVAYELDPRNEPAKKPKA